MSSPRVWFITGTSSGFGRSMSEYALSQGDIVAATLHKPEILFALTARYPADKLLVLKVDVTKQEDIYVASSCTREVFGRLDIVLNNAGYMRNSKVRLSIKHMRCPEQTSGANVSRTAIKFFKEVNEPGKGGVLVQTSSSNAIDPHPELGYYYAATRGFSYCLAKELPPSWNVKMNMEVIPQHSAYADESSATSVMRRLFDGRVPVEVGDAEKFARTIYQVIHGGKIPQCLPVGLDVIEMLTAKIESLKATSVETAPWSADLK
ncbi:hypothetical protein EDB19DRAFT_1930111 [Suillus lakei]|nr:hypothetical protein EDB19DRAFT_1930111 [Suillus lakei]